FQLRVDWMKQRGAGPERAQLLQTCHELSAMSLRGTFAIPIDERATRQRLRDNRLLQNGRVFSEIIHRGAQHAPVLRRAENVHDALAADVIVAAENVEVCDLQFV